MTKITVAFLRDVLNQNYREEISFSKMVELINNELRPEDEAMKFIQKLRKGGKIVSSGELANESIAQAQACRRFFTDNESFGYVYFPKIENLESGDPSNSEHLLNIPDVSNSLITCQNCGQEMTHVRPGKYQCDNPNCT